MTFHLITISNKDISKNLLSNSSLEYGFKLSVINPPGEWKANIQKFDLILDFLIRETNPEDVVCFVDAFDVIANHSPEQLLNRFQEFGESVVFGAERNFFLAQERLRRHYIRNTPNQDRPYQYLNSGTYIGKSKHILSLIRLIIERYSHEYLDNGQFVVLSDQNFFIRAYVDQAQGQFQLPFAITLDHEHQLFGCTGGRMFVFPWLGRWPSWSFFYYKKENAQLKKFNAKGWQNRLIDYVFDDFFINRLTRTRPIFVHCPGSYDQFEALIRVNKQAPILLNTIRKMIKVGAICLIAVLRTIPVYLFLNLRHGFRNEPIQNYYFKK